MSLTYSILFGKEKNRHSLDDLTSGDMFNSVGSKSSKTVVDIPWVVSPKSLVDMPAKGQEDSS